MKKLSGLLVMTAWFSVLDPAQAAPPKAADDRLIVELIAKEPEIVTPTGIAVDERGRIWVIENHTHQRPAKYKGPMTDRIRIFEDFGPDGKARKITTWAEGFRDTMSIALGKDGDVFVATRSAIFLLRDEKNEGKANVKKVLAQLDTKTNYPHNGLSGFAIDALGELHFGLGENFGAPYKLIGTDKTTLTGAGEGGNIYRMKPDGSGLTRIATGFWNPFHMAFDRWGRLFAVDNDPDARGPCRLLHIVQDGDYGYRFKYGRKGIHPFQSWNGELPGTLPMVCGTAEAPSGIVAYESDGLPEEYRGLLFVTSWGDHVIEQFQLEPRGASFGAKKKIMVRGDSDFRPVGIVTAPDGSLIVSDWVDQSYPVHGKGRIWRIRMKNPPVGDGLTPSKAVGLEPTKLRVLLNHPKREIRVAAGEEIAKSGQDGLVMLYKMIGLIKDDKRTEPIECVHALWAAATHFPDKFGPILWLANLPQGDALRGEALFVAGRIAPDGRRFGGFQADLVARFIKGTDPYTRMHALRQVEWSKLGPADWESVVKALADPDPFVASAASRALGRGEYASVALMPYAKSPDPMIRLGVLLALRSCGEKGSNSLASFLKDQEPAIRRAAIQWVAEDGLSQYAHYLDDAAAKSPVTRDLFEAWLAAREMFANPGTMKDANKELGGDAFVLKIVNDAKQPAMFRTLALRMLRPDHPKLALPSLLALAKDADPALRAEAVKTLAWRNNAATQAALRELAADDGDDVNLRGDAVLGLAYSASSDAKTRELLLKHVYSRKVLMPGALRSLRGALSVEEAKSLDAWWRTINKDAVLDAVQRDEVAEQVLLTLGILKATSFEFKTPRPDTAESWRDLLLTAKGDPAEGERVFFHSKGPRCFACHKIDGRGEAVGPDLSRIGAAMNRDKLIELILEPSKEIAPAFVTWLVTLRNGKQLTGVIVGEGFDSTVTIADAAGKRTAIKITDIEDRVAQNTLIMPADLHAQMTRKEFVDLLAFLEGRK